ncbi:MAG: hypothetical protein HQK49_01295 [Oligoflexia bacterium]|nr:hypothetical protein [Oligoflexia bacterium]
MLSKLLTDIVSTSISVSALVFTLNTLTLAFALTFMFTSCSNFEANERKFEKKIGEQKFNQQEEINRFQNNFKKMCFDGEGKGRIVFEENIDRFGFESTLNLTTRNWALLFFFPMHKEEMLTLSWGKNEREDALGGSLSQRMVELKQKKDFRFSWLEVVWPVMGHFFRFYEAKDFSKCYFDEKLSKKSSVPTGFCEYSIGKLFKWRNSESLLEVEFELRGKNVYVIVKSYNNIQTIKVMTASDREFARIDLLFEIKNL